MHSMTKAAFIVLFGLLIVGGACSSSSKGSARDGGPDGLWAGGSGGHTPAGSSGGPSSGGGGGNPVGGNSDIAGSLATGGVGGATGGSAGSVGTSAGGNTGGGGRSTVGSTGSGGRSTDSGGALGSGGRSTAGSSTKTGGTSAAGTTGSGGSQTGGSGGNANLDGGADLGSGPDATLDTARPDGPADLAQNRDTGGNNTSFDACFADLPKPVGTQMIATKQSSDNRIRIRIALDTEDRMGTSGTYGWGLVRLALEVDGEVTCMKDRTSLKYTGSHHNCSDSATATSGSTTYTIKAPDRSQAQIIINGGTVNGTWSLTDSTCSMAGSLALPAGCRSGGPC